MENFWWEQSPERQRERDLYAAFCVAEKAKDEAGKVVLSCLRIGYLDTPFGQQDRSAYVLAYEAYGDAFVAWQAASKAFDTSPAGQAFHRWFRNRIAREATPAPEETAA